MSQLDLFAPFDPTQLDIHVGVDLPGFDGALYHGDCREVLPGLDADALITDPPYGINLGKHGGLIAAYRTPIISWRESAPDVCQVGIDDEQR